jgi:hypothetical protein
VRRGARTGAKQEGWRGLSSAREQRKGRGEGGKEERKKEREKREEKEMEKGEKEKRKGERERGCVGADRGGDRGCRPRARHSRKEKKGIASALITAGGHT